MSGGPGNSKLDFSRRAASNAVVRVELRRRVLVDYSGSATGSAVSV